MNKFYGPTRQFVTFMFEIEGDKETLKIAKRRLANWGIHTECFVDNSIPYYCWRELKQKEDGIWIMRVRMNQEGDISEKSAIATMRKRLKNLKIPYIEEGT